MAIAASHRVVAGASAATRRSTLDAFGVGGSLSSLSVRVCSAARDSSVPRRAGASASLALHRFTIRRRPAAASPPSQPSSTHRHAWSLRRPRGACRPSLFAFSPHQIAHRTPPQRTARLDAATRSSDEAPEFHVHQPLHRARAPLCARYPVPRRPRPCPPQPSTSSARPTSRRSRDYSDAVWYPQHRAGQLPIRADIDVELRQARYSAHTAAPTAHRTARARLVRLTWVWHAGDRLSAVIVVVNQDTGTQACRIHRAAADHVRQHVRRCRPAWIARASSPIRSTARSHLGSSTVREVISPGGSSHAGQRGRD